MIREVVTRRDARRARAKRIREDAPLIGLVALCGGALLIEIALGVSLVVAWVVT